MLEVEQKKKAQQSIFLKKNLYFRDICVQSVLILSLKVDAQILILMNDHKTSKREIAHEHKSHDQPMQEKKVSLTAQEMQ